MAVLLVTIPSFIGGFYGVAFRNAAKVSAREYLKEAAFALLLVSCCCVIAWILLLTTKPGSGTGIEDTELCPG